MCNIVPSRCGYPVLVFALGLLSAIPVCSHAQAAQHRQTDLDFTKRLAARADALHARVQKLERRIAALAGEPMPQTREHVLLGRQLPAAADSDGPGRIKVRLETLARELDSERRRLAAHEATHVVQSSGSGSRRQSSPDTRIAEMEHDLAALEREASQLETERRKATSSR